MWNGPLNTRLTVKEFKNQLSKKIGRNETLMRLREKNHDRLTKVYHDSKHMEFYKMYDNKQLAIQILEEPEDPNDNEVLVMAKLWDPNSWYLSSLKEFYIEKTCILPLFGAFLESLFDVPVINMI